MNKVERFVFASTVLSKLQKRDQMVLDNEKLINMDTKIPLSLTEYNFACAIAKIFRKLHQIPQPYLKYYLKPINNVCTNNLDSAEIIAVKNALSGFSTKSILLAGGSLSTSRLIFKGNNNFVRKTAEGWVSAKLYNEIKLICTLHKYPNISTHLPKILKLTRKKNFTSALLVYYFAETLSYKILFNKITKIKAWQTSQDLLNFVKNNLWVKNISNQTKGYINNFFLKRMKLNLSRLNSTSSLFRLILKTDKVVINGHVHFNLLAIIKIISEDKKLIKKLAPPEICTIWGDLHPNNVLLYKDNFILIDARGDLMGDYLYDLGKMYHTFGPGRYDFIDNDLFNVSLRFKGRNTLIDRNFFINHPAWTTYDYLEKEFLKNLQKFISPNDKYWQLRWKFINFCIFATMPLFLIKNDINESRAIMGYSNAVIFGNEFLRFWESYEQKH